MSKQVPVEYNIIDLLCQLMQAELDLSVEDVWIYNQRKKIPNTTGLKVVVAQVSQRPFSTQTVCDADDEVAFSEFQSVNVQETYRISLFSYDESAMKRNWEATVALASDLSQRLQEQFCFHIAPLTQPFQDVSFLEASANLFRQDVLVVTMRAYYKAKTIPYYDKFSIPPQIHVNQ